MLHPLARAVREHLSDEEWAKLDLNGGTQKAGDWESRLNDSGLVDAEALARCRAEAYGFPFEHLNGHAPEGEALQSLPTEALREFRCLPLRLRQGALTVAIADPGKAEALEAVQFLAQRPVEFVVASEPELDAALEEYGGTTVTKMLEGMASEEGEANAAGEYFIHDLEQRASEPTLINLVNLILSEAVEEGASDIHIEPYEHSMRVKYRIDGVLQETPPPPKALQPAIVSRVKIMAGMDIAKRHEPQDGYIRINVAKRQIDIRVATVPTIFGEGVVMRILDKSSILLKLEDLGFGPELTHRFQPLLGSSHGIVLVCGPTGSGKTTTLYAVLNKIYTPEKKIITIEDPVEYQLDGINQIPVRPQRGVTFATGLRSVLRLDPDILLVGEIRDLETAEIAIRAALTGHMVFSTLHTNDAPSAITRLLDMGIEPYLIASSLRGALAQRLVRRLCPHCKAPFQPDAGLLSEFDATPEEARDGTFFLPHGCEHCKGRGYQGRFGIFELLTFTDELRRLVIERAPSHQIKNAAGRAMKSMRADGWDKVKRGLTTFEEVLRQTMRDGAEDDEK